MEWLENRKFSHTIEKLVKLASFHEIWQYPERLFKLQLTWSTLFARHHLKFPYFQGPPAHHERTRKNSNILRPNQFLDKKEFKINPLGEASTDSFHAKEIN